MALPLDELETVTRSLGEDHCILSAMVMGQAPVHTYFDLDRPAQGSSFSSSALHLAMRYMVHKCFRRDFLRTPVDSRGQWECACFPGSKDSDHPHWMADHWIDSTNLGAWVNSSLQPLIEHCAGQRKDVPSL